MDKKEFQNKLREIFIEEKYLNFQLKKLNDNNQVREIQEKLEILSNKAKILKKEYAIGYYQEIIEKTNKKL